MIAPIMPFLSEELWQRLPRRQEDNTESVTIASFPEYDSAMDDSHSERAYDLLLGCSKGVRSLMAEYSIKDEGKAYVQALDVTSYETAKAEIQSIRALSGKGVAHIEVLSPSQPTPTGCAVFAVSASAAVFLEIKGRVNIDTEITKAQTKMKKAADGATKQRKLLNAPDFAEKVSEAVKETEQKKLEDLLVEQRNYERSIEQFERLKLEG